MFKYAKENSIFGQFIESWTWRVLAEHGGSLAKQVKAQKPKIEFIS